MITVAEADRLLSLHIRPRDHERVPLSEAVGRVLAEEVAADRPYPPFDRVTMDGVAIAHAAWSEGVRHFRIASTQRAGEAPHSLDDAASCIEIMTGAVLPRGCDTVIRYEDLVLEGGSARVIDGADVEAGQNVHRRGSDGAAGSVLMRPGAVLLPPQVAAMASVGRAEVLVATLPRIAVLTTGDELVAVGAPVLEHQIRRSNGHAVRAALGLAGYRGVELEHVPDSEERIRAALAGALADADVVVVSGGVSAGRFDLVPSALAELGVEKVFHGVRQKPGKPLWFGTSPGGPAVFGLPGNPVSALVCLHRYTLPHLAACAGATAAPGTALLSSLPARTNDFARFLPVVHDGATVRPVSSTGSGDFLSLLPSDGFVEVAADVLEPGPVPYYSWRGA